MEGLLAYSRTSAHFIREMTLRGHFSVNTGVFFSANLGSGQGSPAWLLTRILFMASVRANMSLSVSCAL